MAEFKPGDRFVFSISEGQYLAGKLLLDVRRQCIKPGLISIDSPLYVFDEALLVQVYRQVLDQAGGQPSEVLIPGIFVDQYALEDGEWKITGYEDIEPAKVEFPEALILTEGSAEFVRGEVRLSIDMEPAEVERINVYHSRMPSNDLADICVNLLGLGDQVKRKPAAHMTLEDSDLRFSKHRPRIYRLLGLDEHISYHELASQFGYDISRFYGGS